MSTSLKKVFGVVLLASLLIAAFALTGCGGSGSTATSEIVGTWEMSGAEVAGEEKSPEYVEQLIAALGVDTVEIIFNDDGTAQESFAAEGATYTYADGKGVLEDEGGSMDFEIVDSKLKIAIDNVTLVFTKK